MYPEVSIDHVLSQRFSMSSTDFEEQGVEINRGEVGTPLFKSVSGIVTGLSDSTIVHEVFIEIRLQDLSVIV